jgi:hypothetical protein
LLFVVKINAFALYCIDERHTFCYHIFYDRNNNSYPQCPGGSNLRFIGQGTI